ncbi:hypothetical protein JTE90_013547, partial [Oedothorax gibbosus]
LQPYFPRKPKSFGFPGNCPACHLRKTAGSLGGIVFGFELGRYLIAL